MLFDFLVSITGKEGKERAIRTYHPSYHGNFSRSSLWTDNSMKRMGLKYDSDCCKQYKWKAGSFFRSFIPNLSLEEREGGLSAADYVLKQYGQKIEFISGYSLEQLKAQTYAYSVCYIIHHYFEPVDYPKKGDLVFYSKPRTDKKPLVGILKKYGRVVSKYSFESPCVFQHLLFFIPDFYGDEAIFFRLKQNPAPYDNPSPCLAAPGKTIPYIIETDYFSYSYCLSHEALKKEIGFSTRYNLSQHFPHIRTLDYIKFEGVCFHYAFGKFLNTYTVPDDLEMNVLRHPKTFLKYFDMTIDPKPGDLGVYYLEDRPVHYGIYLADNLIESKWGQTDVYEHPFFDTPLRYGQMLRFFKLKPGLTKEAFQANLRLDQKGRSSKEPVILSADKTGRQTLLLFSFRRLAMVKPKDRHRGDQPASRSFSEGWAPTKP